MNVYLLALFFQETQPAGEAGGPNMIRIGAGVLAVILVAVVILRRKRSSKKEEEEEF